MPAKKHIKNILLPRFDTIGDLLLLEPFLKKLQEVYSEATIYLLIRKKYDSISQLFPDQIQWIYWEVNPFLLTFDVKALKDYLESLKMKPWDLILFTKYEHTWLEYIIAGYLNDTLRITLSPMEKYPYWILPYLNDLDMNHYFSPCELVPVEERLHELNKYQILISHLAREEINLPTPELTLPESFRKKSLEILQSLGLGSKTYYACLPGGIENISIKRWPPEKFAKVITWLKEKFNMQPLLIGNEKEQAIVEEVLRFVGKEDVPPIWLGKDGEIPLLAGILKHSNFYFGNDSGPMHISAAFGIPVVALFGGGTWPRFLPKGSESHVVMSPMPCYYCHWKCVFGDAPCIKNLPVSFVQKALEIVVNKSRSDRKDTTIHEVRLYSGNINKLIRKAGITFKEKEADREARLEAIKNLERRLQESEADRAKRLEVINELAAKLEERELDRAARLKVIEELEKRLQEIEVNYANNMEALDKIKRCLEESERERGVQLEAIRDRDQKIEKINQELEEKLRIIEELESRLQKSEAENKILTHQLDDFKELLKMEEDNRLQQLQIIQEQQKRIEIQKADLVKLSMIYKVHFIDK